MKYILMLLVISLFGSHGFTEPDPNFCDGCLLLSPFIDDGDAKTARTLSRVDPEPFFGIKSHSGFINVNKKYDSNLFFWFFPVEEMAVSPWIIWLGGGPGITSLKGLFDVMGPLKIEAEQVKLRNITWASNHSLLFIDNPVGAGFSFTRSEKGDPDNEDDIGAQMLLFLQQFLEIFPELETAPLFVTGQSYAGKYAPALAIQIHRQRHSLLHPINLRGIAMGNGLIDPRNMMNYSQVCTVLGILDDREIEELRGIELSALRLADEGRMINAANKFNETIEYIKKHSGVNIYNYQLDPPRNKAPDFQIYLNQRKVRELIHVGNVTFEYNNQKVYTTMLPDFMNSTKPFVEELLEHYGVMSYSGQMDIIIAYSLSRNVFKTLDWSHRPEYVNAPRLPIYDHYETHSSIVGYMKSGGNFVDVLIRNAGHNAVTEQPVVAKYIIDSFIDEFK